MKQQCRPDDFAAQTMSECASALAPIARRTPKRGRTFPGHHGKKFELQWPLVVCSPLHAYLTGMHAIAAFSVAVASVKKWRCDVGIAISDPHW